jgi:tRNA G18 (ribose-2'-O)-methylase SpoU
VEDIFQMHNTSAVMRSCEIFGIQELNVIEQRYGKSIDKEIAWAPKNGLTLIPMIVLQLA